MGKRGGKGGGEWEEEWGEEERVLLILKYASESCIMIKESRKETQMSQTTKKPIQRRKKKTKWFEKYFLYISVHTILTGSQFALLH